MTPLRIAIVLGLAAVAWYVWRARAAAMPAAAAGTPAAAPEPPGGRVVPGVVPLGPLVPVGPMLPSGAPLLTFAPDARAAVLRARVRARPPVFVPMRALQPSSLVKR